MIDIKSFIFIMNEEAMEAMEVKEVKDYFVDIYIKPTIEEVEVEANNYTMAIIKDELVIMV